jgi:NAD-dependent DNA ligase
MSLDALVKKLTAANLAYRNTEKLLMTDEEYDEGLEALRALAPNHPLLTQIGADEAKSVNLPSKMASLDKVIYGEGALEKWKKKYVSGSYVVSEKLDGISCLYVSAGLTDRRLYLRGNGVKGVDVSGLIGKIHLEKMRTKNFIVRGELVLKKANTPKGSIGRSLINGWVHRLESAAAELANVHFLAYQVIEPAGMKRRQEFEWLSQYFEIPWTRTLANPMLTEEMAKNLLVKQRGESEYPTDGLVIATDAVPLASLEQGLKNPKDCIAFKAALDEQKRTTLVRGIEWNLSRQGFLIPTILIEPVVIGEANIERLSGHNAATILKHKLGPGARIIVRRSGDVIPTLDTVLEGCSLASMPVASWSWDENETHAVLTTVAGQETKEAKVKALVHALQTFEIPGVGEGVVEKMVEGGFDTMAKLWKAGAGELGKAIGPGRGPKVVEALKAITPSESAMLIASNLLPRGVGERKLSSLFAIEADPRLWTVQKFDNVPGWGTASIDELLRALPAALEWGKFRGPISAKAVVVTASQAPVNTNGKSVVFTGVRDKVLEERLKAQGWEISGSVTKKTTVVVIADSGAVESGKTKKANEYGVRIMSISEFSATV